MIPLTLAYWPLDETDGNIALDVQNNNNGTLIGFSDADDVNGVVNNGLQFTNNVDQQISIPTDIFTGFGSWSIAMWINSDSSLSFSRLFNVHADTFTNALAIDYLSAQTIAVRWRNQFVQFSSTNTRDSNNHHVIVTFDNSTHDTHLYVDNVEIGTGSIMPGTTDQTLSSITAVSIGNFASGPNDARSFGGLIDEVYLDTKIWSSVERESIYNDSIGYGGCLPNTKDLCFKTLDEIKDTNRQIALTEITGDVTGFITSSIDEYEGYEVESSVALNHGSSELYSKNVLNTVKNHNNFSKYNNRFMG